MYPKFKYHAKQEPVIVASAAEEAKLGEGWAETPAAFDAVPAHRSEEVAEKVATEPEVAVAVQAEPVAAKAPRKAAKKAVAK